MIQEYNPTDHKLESAISYEGTIHQLIIQDNTYCIMDFNTINVSHVEDNKLLPDYSIQENEKYDYCGGFYYEN